MTKGALVLGLSLMVFSGSGAAQGLESLVSPGALSRAHQNVEGLDGCDRCHTPGQGVDDDKCLACHRQIAARIHDRRGFHRTRGEQCATCHPEHRGEEASLLPWDPTHFDHSETGYPLTGYHARVGRCESCHSPERSVERVSGRSFLLKDRTCVTCHEDVHNGSLGGDCGRCHGVERKFTEVHFDHEQAAFHLRGAHRDLECSKCHRGGQWKGVAFSSCTDCHSDAHQPSLGSDCAKCHSVSNWRVRQARLRFHGEDSSFPLRGKHAGVPCRSCHPENRFKAIAFGECRNCHVQDPHRGQFSQDCSACHVEEGFERTTFNHQQARLHLTGKHLDVECARCHRTEEAVSDGQAVRFIRYRPLSLACDSCHRDVHLGQLGDQCQACHSTFGFGESTLSFSHDSGSDFPLEGAHLQTPCAECHHQEQGRFPGGAGVAIRFAPLNHACKGCHQDPHAGQLAGNCERCHNMDRFLPVTRFDHQRSGFPLTGLHEGVACVQCHPLAEVGPAGVEGRVRRYHPLSLQCSGCHADPHQYRQPADCARCHSTKGFTVQFFNHFKTAFPLLGRHAQLPCERCHERVPWQQKTVLEFVSRTRVPNKADSPDTACLDCHASPHRASYAACERCHTFDSWRISDW